ncbi:MAG: quinone-dependent dihydroorotate dehydrogenase [Fimbriimonadaceae bacterium]|nr:quinone-dependent dihydroorotate dehydrogenase [Fimbriimonadaceae bacterium]
MSLYQGLLRPLLFRLDPETAHNLAVRAVESGLVRAPQAPASPRRLFGVDFPNVVGLAAGFDKDARAVDHWHKLGFGFVEVGSVTRHAQPGNPKPRLWRFPGQRALVNRMGFNNEGADAMANRLERADPRIPLGINIGKSKVTPADEAAEDYAFSFRRLKDFAAYVVVNVSSPNTPGLRGLQDKQPLTRILWRLREIDGAKPLFVKVAPDLGDGAYDDIAEVVHDFGLTGLVVSNTTVARPGMPPECPTEGGLSGEPLRPLADDALARFANLLPDAVLMGVGGVMGPADARRKLELGASLVQVYTGWVYGGPDFVPELVSALSTSIV